MPLRDDWLDRIKKVTLEFQAVREFRNSLVHEREDVDVEPIPISTARSYLCHFFKFLPREWPDA